MDFTEFHFGHSAGNKTIITIHNKSLYWETWEAIFTVFLCEAGECVNFIMSFAESQKVNVNVNKQITEHQAYGTFIT